MIKDLAIAWLSVALLMASVAFAQTVEGVEAGRLREDAKRNATDAKAFADQVSKRGNAFKDDAAEMARGALANKLPPSPGGSTGRKGAFDFDELIADAAQVKAGRKPSDGPQFYAFTSLSMPVPALKALIADVGRAGGVVVFRGFPNNSIKEFGTALRPMFEKDQKIEGLAIDPRLFRAFHIEAVPAYVVAASAVDLCSGFHCTIALPPHDRITGNMTVGYALTTMAEGGGAAATAARSYLHTLQARGEER